ncbi:MAG TPA: glucose-1-phosphate thymidylyltransferase [Solirubrobacterales bacterium]|nr:glucose-1-phosphate thymidylyltransferase [Solirubrobacterales bacterium]
MQDLKGLILSGGAGTRLRPITHTSAKQLVPVANKPVLFYGIEALVDAGVTEIGIIIAPETGDEIREAAGDGSAFGAKITYIVQDKPAGLAHAVLTAEEFIGGSPFVMYLGDNLLADGLRGLVSTFREEEPDALILLTPVDDPQSYGVAELDGEGGIVRLIEKPKDPPSNLALVGVYLFAPPIFDAARALEPSWRGELEITEAIQSLIEQGKAVRSEVVSGWWKDTGQLADMLEANRLVLEEIETAVEGDVDDASRVEGRVVVAPGAEVKSSVVRGPAVIGPGARIEDAYIGPYSSIGEDVCVRRSEVEHSIILAGSVVEDLGTRLEASLLGRDVKLTRSEGMPKTLRMLVGDKSEIKLI